MAKNQHRSKEFKKKILTPMLILGQISYFLGPTIFKIPQPNWYYCWWEDLAFSLTFPLISTDQFNKGCCFFENKIDFKMISRSLDSKKKSHRKLKYQMFWSFEVPREQLWKNEVCLIFMKFCIINSVKKLDLLTPQDL